MKGEWILGYSLDSLALARPLVSRFSFIRSKGSDLWRFEAWLALLSISALGGNLSVKCNFLLGSGMREMPFFKGLLVCQ